MHTHAHMQAHTHTHTHTAHALPMFRDSQPESLKRKQEPGESRPTDFQEARSSTAWKGQPHYGGVVERPK